MFGWVLTESAAAQWDRLQLDRRGFLKACGGQSVQHRLRQQQRAEVYPFGQQYIIGSLSYFYVVCSSLHGGGHVECLPPSVTRGSQLGEGAADVCCRPLLLRCTKIICALLPPLGQNCELHTEQF